MISYESMDKCHVISYESMDNVMILYESMDNVI